MVSADELTNDVTLHTVLILDALCAKVIEYDVSVAHLIERVLIPTVLVKPLNRLCEGQVYEVRVGYSQTLDEECLAASVVTCHNQAHSPWGGYAKRS